LRELRVFQIGLGAVGLEIVKLAAKKIVLKIVDCIKEEANVISTCEELSYPFYKHSALAKKYRVRILGTRINPGFLMYTLVTLLTTVCQEVESIVVKRVIGASHRRQAFQRKIGVALTEEEFASKIEGKEISGHLGFEEPIARVCGALGWKLQRIECKQPKPGHKTVRGSATPILQVGCEGR